MKFLHQELDTRTDSFSYTIVGEDKPKYVVDSNACLIEEGKAIGWFKLRNNQWHLYINDELIESGPENGLFKLPEFELASLTRLINKNEEM